MFGVLLLFICICLLVYLCARRFAAMEEKSSVDPEDQELSCYAFVSLRLVSLTILAPTFVLI